MNSVDNKDCKYPSCIVPGLYPTLSKVGGVTEASSPVVVIFRYGYESELVSRQWPSRARPWEERLTPAATLLKRGMHV